MKLYTINQELQAVQAMLEEWAIEHDGDITDFPLNENLAGIEMERENKLLSIACVIKDYESDVDGIDAEMKKLAQRKKSAQSKADSVRSWLERNIDQGEKFSDSRAAISWRASKSVEVNCEPEQLPENMQRVTIAADKAAIKDALSKGESIQGCALVTRQNMQVK
jgi:hypothetical protein